jgi:hypothetical protein
MKHVLGRVPSKAGLSLRVVRQLKAGQTQAGWRYLLLGSGVPVG